LKRIIKPALRNQKNMIWVFGGIALLMCALMVRLAWIQIINHDEYTLMAEEQQTSDTTLEAKRGTIYDRNGNVLAISNTCYNLYARPSKLKEKYTDKEIDELSEKLSAIIEMEKSEIYDLLASDKTYLTVKKYLTKEQYKEVKALNISSLELAETIKRYYPLGSLASQTLGSVTDDNTGRSGLELEYDQYLSGVNGRWVKVKDNNGNELANSESEYYPAQDGLNVVTTIDQVIQYYVETAIQNALETTQAEKIECIVMSPKTGEILAMASTNCFDPNDPMEPAGEEAQEKFFKMTNEEQVDYLIKMWRNPVISDLYEPGSTFKLITAASALEENAITLTEKFSCGRSIVVSGIRLGCWSPRDHGSQTIRQAIGNSCNPALVQVANRLGKTKLYQYIQLFGLTEMTGVDYPSEASPIVYDVKDVGPVELATTSYGHGIAVSPLQLLTAINAIGNNGILLTPHFVSALTDSEGNVVESYEPTVVRKVLSEETCDEIKDIMRYVVQEGGGGAAKIVGYDIGGKTGTANKINAGEGTYSDSNYCSSFLGMAPMDDPQISILVMVDSPKGSYYGSTVAAPVAKAIFNDVLRYLNIEPEYTKEELKQIESKYTTVPDVTGIEASEAAGILAGKNLTIDMKEELTEDEDFVIVSQYPKAGTKVKKNSSVYVYKE